MLRVRSRGARPWRGCSRWRARLSASHTRRRCTTPDRRRARGGLSSRQIVRYRTISVSNADSTDTGNLGFLLAKASQRWNELLTERFAQHGFSEVRPSYGSVLLPLFEQDGL